MLKIIGTILLLVSVSTYIAVALWGSDPTLWPYSGNFPTQTGAFLSSPFQIGVPGIYGFSLEVDAQNKTDELTTLSCKINLQVSNQSRIIYENRLQELKPAYQIEKRLGYDLGEVNFANKGTYQMTLVNQQSLSVFDGRNPTLTVKITGPSLGGRLLISQGVGFICIVMGIVSVGIIILGFIIAVFTRMNRYSHNEQTIRQYLRV